MKGGTIIQQEKCFIDFFWAEEREIGIDSTMSVFYRDSIYKSWYSVYFDCVSAFTLTPCAIHLYFEYGSSTPFRDEFLIFNRQNRRRGRVQAFACFSSNRIERSPASDFSKVLSGPTKLLTHCLLYTERLLFTNTTEDRLLFARVFQNKVSMNVTGLNSLENVYKR